MRAYAAAGRDVAAAGGGLRAAPRRQSLEGAGGRRREVPGAGGWSGGPEGSRAWEGAEKGRLSGLALLS